MKTLIIRIVFLFIAISMMLISCDEEGDGGVQALKIAPMLQLRYTNSSNKDLLASKEIESEGLSFFSSTTNYKVDIKAISADSVIIFVPQVFFDSRDGGTRTFYVRLSAVDTDTLFIKATTRPYPGTSADTSFGEDSDEFEIVRYNGKEVPALELRQNGRYIGWHKYFEIGK
jgi:hypothetical protein